MYNNVNDYEVLYMINENSDYYEIILEKYKPLVISLCKNYLKSAKKMGYELEDLIQIANIAIFNAINNYDEYKNIKFSTYLTTCVKNNLYITFRENSSSKKMCLNEAISYDEILPGMQQPLLDYIEDKNAINPYEYLNEEEKRKIYTKFINSLPFEVSIVYQLKINGFTQREIRRLMDINNKELKSHLKYISNILNKKEMEYKCEYI